MKLVYRTDDMTRAEDIVALLLNQNIEASIEGKHTFNLRKYIPGGSLSVWIHDNSKIEKAAKILSEIYEGEESPNLGVTRANPMSPKAIAWFVILWIVVTIVVVLGMA
jgi:hypothetical protein